MKKISLTIALLLVTLIWANNTYAAQNGPGSTNGQVQQQTQILNQGTETQVQTETKNQVQNGNTVNQNGSGNGVQLQQQEQQQLQDGSEAGNQVQKQNQGQVQSGPENSQQRRSQVANAVQEIIQIAENNNQFGQQIKAIAQAQNQNQIKIEESLEKVQSRSGFTKFFVGPNYGEINNAEKILEQNREQIQQLNQIMSQITNQSEQQALTEQVEILEQSNIGIENALKSYENGFSLLGWMFKLFSK